MVALLNPAPNWNTRSDEIVLWHGCTSNDVTNLKAGIDPRKGRPDTDFGQGFYTTTIKRQARHWAWMRYYNVKAGLPHNIALRPMVLRFCLRRHDLASLKCLAFGAGDYGNQDFWSLVQHCRQSPTGNMPYSGSGVHDHLGPNKTSSGEWYDVVCGPVAAFWPQRSAMQSADQVSFHTAAAARLLDQAMRSATSFREETVL